MDFKSNQIQVGKDKTNYKIAILKLRNKPSNQVAAWWVFFCILLIINIPNYIPWERNLYPTSYFVDLQERFVKCALLGSIFLSFFSRPWMAWLVSWCLFAWWLPAAFAVRWLSNAPITSNLVGMAMASSAGELRNLALSVPSDLFVVFFIWNLACAAILITLKKRSSWHWSLRLRIKIIIICSLLLLIPYIFLNKPWGSPPKVVIPNQPIDAFHEGDQEIGFDADLPRAFPYELPWAFAQYWQARRVVNAARASLIPAPTTQALSVEATAPDIVVLVVGESSSRTAWHLFNPKEVATTPRLESRLAGGGLYPLSNVAAQTVSTRQAVPSMLTPQPLIWPDGKPNPRATQSIVSLVSRAGYSSAWFSNQAAIGRYDGIIAAYADEADIQAFLNPSSFFQQGTYDDVLLPILRRHLADHAKSFVVLHMMGSHFKFEHRYPPGFGLFPEAQSPDEAYKNSIAYTDTILDGVIDILARDGRSAAMVYVSDHGQGMPDAHCNKTSINRLTADSYEVPAFVWLSPSYEAAHPYVRDTLNKNKETPYTTAAVYQTLGDLISGSGAHDAANVETNTTSSFLRPPGSPQPQMVVSPNQQWVDFKEASTRNRCFINTR